MKRLILSLATVNNLITIDYFNICIFIIKYDTLNIKISYLIGIIKTITMKEIDKYKQTILGFSNLILKVI